MARAAVLLFAVLIVSACGSQSPIPTASTALTQVPSLTVECGNLPAADCAPSPPLDADGIPTQIDGQRVYRVNEQAEWQNLSGSFLLGAYPSGYYPPCPLPNPGEPTTAPAPADLLGEKDCNFGTFLVATAGQLIDGTQLKVAPKGADLGGWLDGPAVVMRVHTHDPEAAQCSADQQAACEAAVVVEAVVWPDVPSEIAGEHVYRATDQASFTSLKGSFLLG